MNVKKFALVGATFALAAASGFSFATETFQYPWYGTPSGYTHVRDCTWQFKGSYGGSWGSQFNYVAVGYCAYGTSMEVDRSAGNNYVTIIIR